MAKPQARLGTGNERTGPPKEPLAEAAARLHAIRQRIVEEGVELLDWDGIDREVRERRGGVG